jgi:hypothetical protein
MYSIVSSNVVEYEPAKIHFSLETTSTLAEIVKSNCFKTLEIKLRLPII